MPMTRKEQAEMDALREQLRIAKALRFTENVLPDVPVPEDRIIVYGFSFNVHSTSIGKSCSGNNGHSSGYIDTIYKKTQFDLTTRGGIRQYSTPLLALRGLRHAVELACAKRLADIDKQIEAESNK